jgi:Cu-Zn family superoxide dismutase
MSTGGHYNPDKVPHGAREDQIRHVGDLGNILADNNGVAVTSFSDSVISLFGSKGVIGRGIVYRWGNLMNFLTIIFLSNCCSLC